MTEPRWRGLLERLPRRAIAAGSGLVAASGFLQAGVFLATVFVARSLGKAALGRYAVAHAIGAVIVSGIGSGMPLLALREVAAHGLSRPFLRKVIVIELVVTCVGTALAMPVGWVLLGGVYGLVLALLAGLAYVMLSQLSLVAGIHAGLKHYGTAARGRVVCGCMIVVLTLAALEAGLGIGGALVAIAAAAAIGTGWLLWETRGRATADHGPDTTRLFARSKPFLGLGLIAGGYQRIDAIVVIAVTSASVAGIYAAAYRMLSPFVLASNGFGTVFLSSLSSMGAVDTEWHAVRRRGTRLFALAVLPVATIAFVAMPYVVRGFYGPEFSGATGPARVLLLSLVPYALYLPNVYALTAAGRERTVLAVLAVSMALETGLMLALAAHYGATGAAWAWVLTECWVFASISLVVRRQSNQPAE